MTLSKSCQPSICLRWRISAIVNLGRLTCYEKFEIVGEVEVVESFDLPIGKRLRHKLML
jgi:hypothetical protein